MIKEALIREVKRNPILMIGGILMLIIASGCLTTASLLADDPGSVRYASDPHDTLIFSNFASRGGGTGRFDTVTVNTRGSLDEQLRLGTKITESQCERIGGTPSSYCNCCHISNAFLNVQYVTDELGRELAIMERSVGAIRVYTFQGGTHPAPKEIHLHFSASGPEPTEPVICGDGTCDSGETEYTCPDDCKIAQLCVPNEQQCSATKDKILICNLNGDTNQWEWRTWEYCPYGCEAFASECNPKPGLEPPICGNDVCDAGETEWSCPRDCGGVEPGPSPEPTPSPFQPFIAFINNIINSILSIFNIGGSQ